MSSDINNPVIVKGPYKQEKCDRLMENTNQLRTWKTPLMALPMLHIIHDDLFIVFPNLNRGLDTEYTIEQKIRVHSSQYSDKRLVRTDLLKLGDCITESSWTLSFAPDIVYACCHLYMLGIGDVNLSNMLARMSDKTVHVIDFEERRGSSRDDSVFFFSSRPAKRKLDIFEPYVTPYYTAIADRLELIECTGDVQSKRDYAISQLRKYSTGDKPYTPRPPTQVDLKVPLITRSARSILSIDNGIGDMFSSGPWINRTYSGFPADEMKSAMQKYIRRGMIDKALMSTFELYRMNEIGTTRVVSNMYNRLAIIAIEDIGPANFPLVCETFRLVRNRDLDPETLVRLIVTLCRSKKSRLGSHVYSVFFRPDGMKLAKERGVQIDDSYPENNLNVEWTDDNNPDMRSYLAALMTRQDMRAFIWLRYYQISGEKVKKLKSFRRRTNYMAPLIHALTNGKGDNYTQLRDAYWFLSEKRPVLVLLVLAHIYQFGNKQGYIWKGSISNDPEKSVDIEWLKRGDYTLELDNFVIDKHTKRGRLHGKTRKDFVFTGGLVTNESDKYKVQSFKDIYNDTA